MREIAARKNYAVLLRCPHRDEDSWVVLQDRTETLEEILGKPWDFECSAHGVQRELPVAANEKGPPIGTKAHQRVERAQRKAESNGVNKRSSLRLYLKIPVQVYGWVRSKGAFHEETSTIVVNSGGCLVPLDTKVDLGDMLFVVNRASTQELQCRVAYLEPDSLGAKVGLAFKNPVDGFWRVNRLKPRFARAIQVTVRGLDRKGDPFMQSAYTVDISEKGARLDGLGRIASTGATIELKRGWRKAQYRVVWIGPPGTPQADQIGIVAVADANIWGGELPNGKS